MFNTSVLFLVFNRLDVTVQSFEQISIIKPKNLFIAADGPRDLVTDDVSKCEAVRNYLLNRIDWNCNLFTLFRDSNLGCGKAVSEAITWFFEHVESGIILEDDCLPNFSFFSFCDELLEFHKNNYKITHISGSNFQYQIRRGLGDYYFSSIFNVWGWATWRRAWKLYNFKMEDLFTTINNHPDSFLIPKNLFLDVYFNKIDTWDVQWSYINFKNNNLAIIPNINLIKNIGFDINATHTIGTLPEYILYSGFGNLLFPLKHPKNIKRNKTADLYIAMFLFKNIKPSILRRIERKLSMLIQNIR